MNFFILAVILIVTLFAGIFGGLFIAKIVQMKRDKKIEKGAIDVIEGKRENVLNINGEKYEASKFRLRNEDGTEIVIDLKGGEIKQDGKTKENNKQGSKEREFIEEDSSPIRKDSSSRRRKKRVTKTRTRSKFA